MRRKKALIDAPVDKLNKKDTIEHYNAMLFEDLKSTMQLVLEAVDGTRVSLETKIEETEQRLTQRLEAVEFAVVRHSKEIKVLDGKFDGLDKKVDSLDKKVDCLDKKVDCLDKKVDCLDKKVDCLDKKVDCLDKKVDSVRTELKEDIARVEGNMVQMEKRLSDKINNVVITRIDDHENRITKLETTSLHPTP